MAEQSTSRTKQYWNYTIPERVKYATGDYFTTLKDDPHHPGLTETEVESCYAAGIQWMEMLIPVRINKIAFEAIQGLAIMFAIADYKGTVIDNKAIKCHDLKMFGLNANELLRATFSNLSDDLFYQQSEEFYWAMELLTLKTSAKSDMFQGLLYKTMATNVDNYLTLRNIDGLFSFVLVGALCCNTDELISKLPKWHDECVNITIWIYDAISASKHRAEGEPCDLSRYIDGGMPESVTNMIEYARQKMWHLNKKYVNEEEYQPYRAQMLSYPSWSYLMYRYRHVEFLGPALAKYTDDDIKATKDEKYVWYKVEQDGGPVGVIKKYRGAIEAGNADDIKSALSRGKDLKAKQVMREVLSDDIKNYNEIDFPVTKGSSVKI